MAAKQTGVWLERVLLAVGCACMSYYGYITLEARQFQRERTAAFDARMAEERSAAAAQRMEGAAAVGGAAVLSVPAGARSPAGRDPSLAFSAGLLGILEIPRLGLTTAVMSGDDAKTLDVAAGHLSDTPKPWEPGNSAIAAHRDGLFRPLKHVKIGDQLRLRTVHGEFEYRVHDLKIVDPTDLSVLDPTGTDTLTLITCYPFNFIGAAPQRFIVSAARLADGTPEERRAKSKNE